MFSTLGNSQFEIKTLTPKYIDNYLYKLNQTMRCKKCRWASEKLNEKIGYKLEDNVKIH